MEFGEINADATEDLGEIVFNPLSGNQDEEYIAIRNPTENAVDITGWKLTGGIDYVFAKGVVIPAGGVLYISPDVNAFRTRTTGPSASQGLFVQGNGGKYLSNGGATVELRAADNTLRMDSSRRPKVLRRSSSRARVSELMYHPPDSTVAEVAAGFGDAAAFEYIELVNIGDVAIDLTERGVHGRHRRHDRRRRTPPLAPGERCSWSQISAAYAMRYDTGVRILGTFSGKLDNAGEQLKLVDANNEKVLDFVYDDNWYPSTDGDGHSLEIVDEDALVTAWSLPAMGASLRAGRFAGRVWRSGNAPGRR